MVSAITRFLQNSLLVLWCYDKLQFANFNACIEMKLLEKSSLVGCWYDNASLKEAKPNKCYQQPMKPEKQHLKPSTHHSQFEILLSAIMLVAFLPLFFLALFPPIVFPDPSSPSAAPSSSFSSSLPGLSTIATSHPASSKGSQG